MEGLVVRGASAKELLVAAGHCSDGMRMRELEGSAIAGVVKGVAVVEMETGSVDGDGDFDVGGDVSGEDLSGGLGDSVVKGVADAVADDVCCGSLKP